MPLDVEPADGLADAPLDERDPSLPAGPQLRGARERAAVEVEVRRDELRGEVRRGRADDLERCPGLPVPDRDLFHRAREVAEEARLPDDDLGERLLVGAEGLGVGLPGEGRCQRPDLVEGLEVVGLEDVAGLRALPVTRCQAGLQGHHPLGCAHGVRDARERQEPLDVGDVRDPDVGELVVAVVGLVRQPQPALDQVDQVAVGVAVVGVDVGTEEAAAAAALEAADVGGELLVVGNLGEACEVGGYRGGAQGLDPLLVHERGPQVADLLGRGPLRGLPGRGRAVLHDRADLLLGLLGDDGEGPPRGAVGRDVDLSEPTAVDVAEEVVLGPDREVHPGPGVVEDRHGGEPNERHRHAGRRQSRSRTQRARRARQAPPASGRRGSRPGRPPCRRRHRRPS